MFSISHHRPTAVRGLLAAVAAVCAVSIAATDSVTAGEDPQRERKEPTAGAPRYLHFGPWGGLCERVFDPSVGEGQIAEIDGVLYIRGGADEQTFVEIFKDDLDTADQWDDELVAKLIVYANGADVTATYTTPYWAPAPGEIGGFGTQNVPQKRSIGFIYYLGSNDARSALDNNTAVPMRAHGWFNVLSTGADGFQGGSGPDCVMGPRRNQRVFTGGGADFVRTRDGDDLVHLGSGPDTAETGGGNDTMRGQGDNDRLESGSGDDCYDGGTGNDVLDDDYPSDLDAYTVDDVWNDYITEPYPFMVDVCM